MAVGKQTFQRTLEPGSDILQPYTAKQRRNPAHRLIARNILPILPGEGGLQRKNRAQRSAKIPFYPLDVSILHIFLPIYRITGDGIASFPDTHDQVVQAIVVNG